MTGLYDPPPSAKIRSLPKKPYRLIVPQAAGSIALVCVITVAVFTASSSTSEHPKPPAAAGRMTPRPTVTVTRTVSTRTPAHSERKPYHMQVKVTYYRPGKPRPFCRRYLDLDRRFCRALLHGR
ncbi:hypothetical protein [Nonomuraea typhae]|uniref:hypothetical protein n=1 Tax=Nonomuraea typhae TaxID=2603600 RepID=UPI0012F82438|nr:hypothetical protein [Nonomuraea typhae]